MSDLPLISVIVPVHNVSEYIVRCAESLMQQTMSSGIEYIFVDDVSTDNSRLLLENVLSKYPGKDVQILTHEKNMGLPASRRTGLAVAKGKYIYNCDSDDWVEPDILELLYNAASGNDADIAYCDFYLTFGESERYMENPDYATADEMLRKGFLGGAAKWNVWNKLFRRELYDGIQFPVEHFKGGEDMIVIEMMAKAHKVAYVNKALYHYVKTNAGAISEGFSQQRLIDIRYNADKAISALADYTNGNIDTEIAFFKLNVKLPFIISDSRDKHNVWKKWYPEANKYIMKNHFLPFRTRFVQWMAWKGQWWYVRMYYRFIAKFVYGVIYR